MAEVLLEEVDVFTTNPENQKILQWRKMIRKYVHI